MTKPKAQSLLALLFLGLLCLYTSIDSLADNHQQDELNKLKRSISALEIKLQSQRQEKGQVEAQIEAIEIDAAKLAQSIRNLQPKITSVSKKFKRLQTQKNNLQKRIDEQRLAIAKQLRSNYKIGREEPIKLLLNQQDPQQIARILKYYDYLLDARSEKIQQFTNDIDRLKKTVDDIQATKTALEKSKNALQTDRKNLATKIKKRKIMLSELEKSLRSDNKKLSTYEQQRDELETVISTVQKVAKKIAPAKDYPSFTSSKGKLSWPVNGKITHGFGSRRTEYQRSSGWLISVRNGAEIKSVHHGRVVFSNYLRGFGLLIIVDHGDGFMSLYAHNQTLLRETGDWIQSGEIISLAGNSGGLTHPALYFEIRQEGIPVNPKIWLIKR